MTYYLSWILKKVFGGNPCAEFTNPQQSNGGWVCLLTDKVNGQEYVCTFTPVELKTKVVMPDTADQFLKLTEGNKQ